MKRSSYRARDYDFGRIMLTCRTTMGLTQSDLAQALGVSRQSVVAWEAGDKYPKVKHLKQFITLCIQYEAFPIGHEEEILILWKASQQKALLDEVWVAELLHKPLQSHSNQLDNVKSSISTRRIDWDNASSVIHFFGREWELSLLKDWVVRERCQVLGLLGMGGIGKSVLSIKLMHEVADTFEVVIWRSLRDAPPCEVLLDDCLQILDPQAITPINMNQRLNLLLEYFRSRRVLLVLDNLETLLQDSESNGIMRSGYEDYETLLQRMAESKHQSCLLFTSREKPSSLVPLEGNDSHVLILRLNRLEIKPCEKLLREKGVIGSDSEHAQLIDAYAGNPLALKIVAQTIIDLFGGNIAPFLDQSEIIFGGVRDLLAQQFARLSRLEQSVLFWLTILREPSTLDELLHLFVTPAARSRMLEAVHALHRRSLIEPGQKPGSFTLQSVVLEYLTARLIEKMVDEIQQGEWLYLIEYGLESGQLRDFIRQTQVRLILTPILERLMDNYHGKSNLSDHLSESLDRLRNEADAIQGYAPANLLALLGALWGHLRGVNLSQLYIRGAYLQGISMQDATLAGATLHASVFTETFDAIYRVAVSGSGEFWAASSRSGEIRLWLAGGQTLIRIWQAHTDMVWALTFSPDSLSLVSASWDGTVKLWDVASAELRWSGEHSELVNSVTFSLDGSMIVSSGNDAVIRFWDQRTGIQLQTLQQPTAIPVVLWSPDGHLLASADIKGIIRLWQVTESTPAVCVQILKGHTGSVTDLAFSPDGNTLASAGWDSKVKLWDVATGQVQTTLEGHREIVYRVAWSPDGRTLASSSRDNTVRLWDVQQGEYREVLRGHHAGIRGLIFVSESLLLTGSEDGTLRLWDVTSGMCLRIWQGYAASLRDLDWSPVGNYLVSVGTDSLVTLYEVSQISPNRVLDGHTGIAFGVRWSPDGRTLASSELNNAIYLWDAKSEERMHILAYPGDVGNFFDGLAWSPDGQMLASGTYRSGVVVWNIGTRSQQWNNNTVSIRNVTWSPNGNRLAGGGNDGVVYIWNAADGHLIRRLSGHKHRVTTVSWSPNGTQLASAGNDQKHSEVIVWNAESGNRICTIAESLGFIYAVEWGLNENIVITGDSNGSLCGWNVQTEKCLWVRNAHQGAIHSLRRNTDTSKLASCGDDGAIMLWDIHSGDHLQTLRRDRPYERLNITGIRGLTEVQKANLRALGAIENDVVSSRI